jgi:hypothetical protein
LEIERGLFFDLLPRVDASWREPGVLVHYNSLEGNDERFGEGGFVSSGRGYGNFVAHEKFARIGVSMIFRWRHGSVIYVPWCEL